MEKSLDDNIYSNVKKTIDSFKKDLDNYITKLSDIKSQIRDPETVAMLNNTIINLKNAKTNISIKDFGISQATKKTEPEFSDGYNSYIYKDLISKDISRQIDENKASLTGDYKDFKLRNKIVKLKAKKGKIQKKQLKLSDKIIAQKLIEYKENNNINFKQLDKIEKKFEKSLGHKVFKQIKYRDEKAKYEKEFQKAKMNTKENVSAAKEISKNIKKIDKKLKRLKKKNGKSFVKYSSAIAKDVKPSIIQRMKNKVREIGVSISNDIYEAKIDNFGAKSR